MCVLAVRVVLTVLAVLIDVAVLVVQAILALIFLASTAIVGYNLRGSTLTVFIG